MRRMEEAKELRRKGFSMDEIAKKMNINKATAQCYVYQKGGLGYRYRRRKFVEDVRSVIHRELSSCGLPLSWEDELTQMFLVYHYTDERLGGGVKKEIDVRSLIHLLCRRYKVPTPRKLEILTYKGGTHGVAKRKSGYIHALETLDGVTLAKPIDYVKYFVKYEDLSKKITEEAEKLISTIPKATLQGKNPRALAGAVLYQIYRPDNPQSQGRIYTQRYISEILRVTPQSLRNNRKKLFPVN